MLCNYLNDIYLNHIYKSLSNDEYVYSQEVEEIFLDLWFSCNNAKTYLEHPDSTFYCINEDILFELYIKQDLKKQFIYCNYAKVWSVFESKYYMKYDDIQQLIKNVVENTLKLGSTTPRDLNWKVLKMKNTLKLGSITPLYF
jgi:hypothetical protein